MLNPLLEQLIQGIDLNKPQCISAMRYLLNNQITDVQKSALLVLLRAKGETVSEMLNFIELCKQQMHKVTVNMPVLDIVGTGGDGLHTINVSTGAALLAASCGAFVVKHGNRAVSSHCGSADVLEAMQIPIHLPVNALVNSVNKNRFGFCFAPLFHPALVKLRELRHALGIPTLFNLIAPCLNPADAKHYVLGVRSSECLKKLAHILSQLPIKKSVVVHSQGMDEMSTLGVTEVAEIDQTTIRYYTITPEDFNLPRGNLSLLQGKTVNENAKALLNAFNGEPGVVADSLALNAGMGLYVYGQVKSLNQGIELAQSNLRQGAVLSLLENLRKEEYTYE